MSPTGVIEDISVLNELTDICTLHLHACTRLILSGLQGGNWP